MFNQILPKPDYKIVADKICQFLKREFKKRNKALAIVGVSGGVDSSLTAELCRRAGLELKRVSMPYGENSSYLKNYSLKVDITKIVDQHLKDIGRDADLDKIEKGKLMARTQ